MVYPVLQVTRKLILPAPMHHERMDMENKIVRFIWKITDKYFGKKHSHEQENARRRRQIERGQLTESNGLVKS